MINKLWMALIVISILYGILTNNIDKLNDTILNTPQKTMTLIINFAALIIFWSGMLEVAKDSGLLKYIAKYLKKITIVLFKDIPRDSVVHEYISGNITANILGLGSAATPLGLKAIEEMQKLNKNKKVASKSMIIFLVINTSGLTLIPTTIISLRKAYGATLTTDIIPYIIIATSITTLFGVLLVKFIK